MHSPGKIRGLLARLGLPAETSIRYTKFCLVGGSGVVVDVVLLYFLSGLHPSMLRLNLSKLLAAEAAILNNFLWNDLWTFSGKSTGGNRGCMNRFLRFNLISASGVLISTLLLDWQVFGLKMNVYLANFLSIMVVSVWNFGLSSRFGWKVAR